MKNFVCVTVFVAFVFLSCKSSVDSIGDENLSITTKNSTVILSNNSNQIIHYLLLEAETATLIDLDPNYVWPSIEADSSVTIPYNEIMGYNESANEVFIIWGLDGSRSEYSLTFKL